MDSFRNQNELIFIHELSNDVIQLCSILQTCYLLSGVLSCYHSRDRPDIKAILAKTISEFLLILVNIYIIINSTVIIIV